MAKNYTYTPKQIADIACVYKRICENRTALNASTTEGPNGIASEEFAAMQLRILLPQYLEIVPQEVQRILGVPVKDLEKLIQQYPNKK